MTVFQEKSIKFLGKSPNPASVEVLSKLLANPVSKIRVSAFEALFLKKEPEVYVLLFKHFVNDEEFWSGQTFLTPERLSRLADAAFRTENAAVRDAAAKAIIKYKLYETLPTVLIYLEGSDEALSMLARKMISQLAELFYGDLASAPTELDRRNLDRRREWFVQQLDGPIKRFAANGIDELITSLLVITKKDYDTMRTILGDHRSAACKRIADLLENGDHSSYIRLLLSYVPDGGAPAVIDEILTRRSDPLFVRKMLEMIGDNPSFDFREALKRFKGFDWFLPGNPELGKLVEGLEPCAVQLLMSSSMPKDRMVKLYRFFLERPSFESRRAAATAVRRLVGDEVNKMLLDFVNDSDATTAATVFRILKARGVEEVETVFPRLVERHDDEIRKAIYDTMPELHVESFASRFGQMTPGTARTTGRYVRLIDPNTFKVINDDIVSPIPIRRLAACNVAAVTGYATDFTERIIEIAETDDETNVRIAAITALGTILTKEAIETIKFLINDRSMDIRDAATAALKEWMLAYQAKFPGSGSK